MTNLFFLGAVFTPAPDYGTYITDDFGNLVPCPIIQWLYAVESDAEMIDMATEKNTAAKKVH